MERNGMRKLRLIVECNQQNEKKEGKKMEEKEANYLKKQKK